MDERNGRGMGVDGMNGKDRDNNLWNNNPETWNRQDRPIGAEVYGGWEDERPGTRNNMALASLVMGIMGIVSACCLVPGLVFGGLAILFACLSRVEEKMSGQALAGLITGIIGILGVFVFMMILDFLYR